MVKRKDVAEYVGVSPAVVSYVLNGSHPVSDKTRAKVLEAVRVLGYRPNSVARSLAIAKTSTIGLLLPDSSNSYFAELSSAIENAAFERGFTVLLGNGADDDNREKNYLRTFVDRQVDGIICTSDVLEQSFNDLSISKVPMVATDKRSDGFNFPSVFVDNKLGAQMATDHLVFHGRKKIACISGGEEISSANDRVSGWRESLSAAGINPTPSLIERAPFTSEGGNQSIKTLLKRVPDVDAIFVASDLQAVGAIRALVDAGLEVGKDISIVGFDGVQLGNYTTPRLTTVAQPITQIAARAVELLIALIEGNPDTDSPEQVVTLPGELIVRESCGCNMGPQQTGFTDQ